MPLVPLLTEAESDRSALIEPVPGLMIWTLATFLIVLFVLKRYAFGPLAKMLDERREKVRNDLLAAEEARADAQRTLDEYRHQLAEARAEASRILEQARRDADERRREMQVELQAERERGIAAAQQSIQAETRQALDRIKGEIADLTIVATEKVLRRSLDEAAQRRLIDEALADVDFTALEGRRA